MSNDVNLIVNFRCSLGTLMGLQQQQKRQTLQVLVVKKHQCDHKFQQKLHSKASLNSLNYTGRELVRAVQQLF